MQGSFLKGFWERLWKVQFGVCCIVNGAIYSIKLFFVLGDKKRKNLWLRVRKLNQIVMQLETVSKTDKNSFEN